MGQVGTVLPVWEKELTVCSGSRAAGGPGAAQRESSHSDRLGYQDRSKAFSYVHAS